MSNLKEEHLSGKHDRLDSDELAQSDLAEPSTTATPDSLAFGSIDAHYASSLRKTVPVKKKKKQNHFYGEPLLAQTCRLRYKAGGCKYCFTYSLADAFQMKAHTIKQTALVFKLTSWL
jgi:hypothetical protein